MDYVHVPKINRELMPQPAAGRNIVYRYDWHLLKPGEGFQFGPTVKISSARVMCSNRGKDLEMVFRCYRGVDEKLYAVRVDGMNSDLPNAAPIAPAPRINIATAPEAAEVLGTYGKTNGRFMPDNLAIVEGLPAPGPDFPPIQKTESQLKAEQIVREHYENAAKRAAAAGEDDPI